MGNRARELSRTPRDVGSTKEAFMADDKLKRGANDRSKVAGGEGYEVSCFAKKHDITAEQARDLIRKVGNNREKLNAAAAKLPKKK